MAVRFKFRSTLAFDSIDIAGKPSVSVGDLKSRILHYKNLNVWQDCDLVVSDAITGQDYNDENLHIASGSSVIIRRVPAGSRASVMAHLDSVKNLETKGTVTVNTSLPVKAETKDFDDIGIELCRNTEATLFGSDLNTDNKICVGSKKGNDYMEVPRCSETPMVGCQKLEPIDLGSSGDHAHNIGRNTLQSEPDVQATFGKRFNANPPAKQNADFPSELNCSLCDTIFKEAVMIPCCQHSFCDGCIRLVLVQQRRCPSCFSDKYGVKDLLPNLCLRYTIEHFLESRNLIDVSNDALCRNVPDEESVIQGKDATKQVMAESACDSFYRKNAPGPFSESQGGSQPVHNEGGDKNLAETGKQRMGVRTCYMCGSPDHFIRDCPAAFGQNSMLPRENALFPGTMPDYVSPYWSGTPLHQNRPFPNLYSNPGMMPFTQSMMPFTPSMMPFTPSMMPGMPFNVSMYMPSVYGGIPALAGCNRPEYLQPCARRKLSNEILRSERSFDADKDNYKSTSSLYPEVERPQKTSERHNKRKRSRSDSGSDPGRRYIQNNEDRDAKRRDRLVQMHNWNKNSRSESGLESRYPSNQVKQQKEKDFRHCSNYSRHNMRDLHNHRSHDRWKTVSRVDEDSRKEYLSHKRKKVN